MIKSVVNMKIYFDAKFTAIEISSDEISLSSNE
jgi:hypothetical protein